MGILEGIKYEKSGTSGEEIPDDNDIRMHLILINDATNDKTIAPRGAQYEAWGSTSAKSSSSMPRITDTRSPYNADYDQASIIASVAYSLIQKMEDLIKRMVNIEQRLSSIESKIPNVTEGDSFVGHIQVQDDTCISREQAKEMILKFFEQKGELDYFDIISTLNLDLKQVVELCAELEEEKKIEGID